MLRRSDISQVADGRPRSRSQLPRAVLVAAMAFGAVGAQAQDETASHERLDRVLAVLRVQQAAASRACLDAMSQVHATEQQVKDHENDTGSHPDLDIAHDVLDSDFQNSAVICGADAERICRERHDAILTKPCGALHHDPS